MGRISLIRISGARLTLCNTPDGPGFLEIRSHEKGPTYCVISSSVSLFRPAGSSLEIRYVPLFLLFFFFLPDMSVHKRGPWEETAAWRPAGAAGATDLRHAPAWGWVTGDLSEEGAINGTLGLEGQRAGWLWGGKLDIPLFTWRSGDHTWLELVKRISGEG